MATDELIEKENKLLRLENLAKLSAVALGAVYLLGFLVVTINLSQYGVAPQEWLRLHYLTAGIWALAIPLFVLVFALAGYASFTLFLRPRIETKPHGTLLTHIAHYGAVAFAAAVAVSIPYGLVTGSFGIVKSLAPTLANSFPQMGWTLVSSFIGASMVLLFLNMLWDSFRSQRRLWAWIIILCVFMAGTLLRYIDRFSRQIYPQLPYSIGGGRPLPVSFLFSDTKPSFLVSSEMSDGRSITYDLLLATDATYVVKSLSENEKAIEFGRSAVLGMVVLDESTWRRDESRAAEAVKMRELYVGNLPPQATEQDLRNWFAQAGIHVDTINLIRDRYSGQPRGFGFVKIGNDDEADRAIQELNGMEFHGRALVVNEARPNREGE